MLKQASTASRKKIATMFKMCWKRRVFSKTSQELQAKHPATFPGKSAVRGPAVFAITTTPQKAVVAGYINAWLPMVPQPLDGASPISLAHDAKATLCISTQVALPGSGG